MGVELMAVSALASSQPGLHCWPWFSQGSLIGPEPERGLSVRISSGLLCRPLPSPVLQRKVKRPDAQDQWEAWSKVRQDGAPAPVAAPPRPWDQGFL